MSTPRRAPITSARVIALVALVIIVRASLPTTAWAANDDKLQAEIHFEAAKKHYDNGNYTAAIDELLKAHSLAPSPVLLYNIAVAYEKLGNIIDARNYYDQYAQGKLSKKEKSAVDEKLEELDAILSIYKGFVTVSATVSDAEVFVDGMYVGKAPIQGHRLAPGTHEIIVKAPGHENFFKSLSVEEPENIIVLANLKEKAGRLALKLNVDEATIEVDGKKTSFFEGGDPLPLAPGTHIIAISKAGYLEYTETVAIPPDGTVNLQVNLIPTPMQESPYKPWRWSLLGVGVAAISSAIAMHLTADNYMQQVTGAPERDGIIVGMTRAYAADLTSKAEQLQIASLVLYGLGGALLSGSLVMTIMDVLYPSTPYQDLGVTSSTSTLGGLSIAPWGVSLTF